GYAADTDFHVTLDFGYGLDRIYMSPGTLQSRSVTVLLGADTPLIRRPWFTLYAGGGIGYSLNTLSQNGNDVEANSSAGYVCLGARFPIAANFALVVEERYTLSSASLPSNVNGPLNFAGSQTTLNMGGNLFT